MSLVLALFLISGAAAVGENLPTEQPTSNDYNIEQGDLEKQGFLGNLFSLSILEVQPSYEQGERAEIRPKATATEDFDTEGSVKVVNLYDCKDTGCNDPPPIDSSSEDSCSLEEWSPDYDDCIANFDEEAGFSTTVQEGETWSWGVEFDAPQDTGQYILVAYIYKNGRVSDVSKEKFVVEEKTTDSDGDGVIDSVDQCPNTYGEADDGCKIDSDGDGVPNDEDQCDNETGPAYNDGCPVDSDGDGVPDNEDECSGTSSSISVDIDGCPVDSDNDGIPDDEDDCPNQQGTEFNNGCPALPEIKEVDGEIPVERSNQDEVMATVELTNTGNADMGNEHIVEMQVNKAGTGLLSLLSFSDYDDKVCDGENDQAVHETFQLDTGEQRQYILTVPIENLEAGQKYDVWIVTRSSCYNTGENNPVDPYGGGVKAGTYTVENASTPGDADRDQDGIINSQDDCPDKAGPESNNGCPEDSGGIPVLPIIAGIVVLGAGGVYYRYGK